MSRSKVVTMKCCIVVFALVQILFNVIWISFKYWEKKSQINFKFKCFFFYIELVASISCQRWKDVEVRKKENYSRDKKNQLLGKYLFSFRPSKNKDRVSKCTINPKNGSFEWTEVSEKYCVEKKLYERYNVLVHDGKIGSEELVINPYWHNDFFHNTPGKMESDGKEILVKIEQRDKKLRSEREPLESEQKFYEKLVAYG